MPRKFEAQIVYWRMIPIGVATVLVTMLATLFWVALADELEPIIALDNGFLWGLTLFGLIIVFAAFPLKLIWILVFQALLLKLVDRRWVATIATGLTALFVTGFVPLSILASQEIAFADAAALLIVWTVVPVVVGSILSWFSFSNEGQDLKSGLK